MNIITKALSEVRFRIPLEILNVVFMDPYQQYRDLPSDMLDRIRFLVLNPRVLVDCNLVGGVETLIPLDDTPSESVDGGYTMVFRVPKSKTNGRTIMAAMDVTYGNMNPGGQIGGYGGYGSYSSGRSSPALQLASQVMDSQLRTSYVGTARVELIGENVVVVKDSTILAPNLYLRCMLENDENLSNIQVRSYHAFSKLVELAVKSYIYNTYIIKLDMGELRGGLQVGRFKDIIDGYADSEQMYQDYLKEKWEKIAFMNDSVSHTRFLSMIIGGSR